MQLGALVPFNDTGGDPATVRDYAQGLEALGYDFLEAPDHVLGANLDAQARVQPVQTIADDMFHDPFVLLGYLAGCTTTLAFSTGVLILPQRQTALVAKQAACLAVLSRERFRLGIGVGWNPIEFVGLNESFTNRGRRSEEQVQVMQALWAEPHVNFQGQWHHIDDAGINPLPTERRVPIWFGGHHDLTLRRIAKWGDGWMMLAYPADGSAEAAFAKLRAYAEEEGRDPASIGLEVWVSTGDGDEASWREEFKFWKKAGVSHVTLNSAFQRDHHARIASRSLQGHLTALHRYRDAVSDLL